MLYDDLLESCLDEVDMSKKGKKGGRLITL